jgi:hypothetical protein
MASSYSDLGIELMATGENAGTWGTKTNTNLQIVEKAIAGYVEQAVTSGGTTALSITDGDATESTSVARHAVIKLTGTITGNSIVTVPDSVEKVYIVTNGTSGAYTVQFKTASGTGITFGVSEKTTRLVYSDGTNLVDAGFGGSLDLEGRELVLDADGDTTITADTDDQIDIKIAGADDFQFTANTFTAQSGSTIAAQALTATTITASGIVKTDDTTEATSTTDGSLQTDGGLSVAKDAVIGDDLKLLSDSAVLSFGADSDTTLTHTDGTGLTLNSTNKLLFRDTGLYINSSTDGQLDIVADTEVQIAATTIDINGAIAMDGAITGATNITLSGELDAATLDISGDADIDGTLETDALSINGTTVNSTAAELNIVDGGTSATSTTVADADRVVLNDNGTMVQVAVTDLAAYFDDEITAMPNLTSVGTLTTLTVDNIIVNGTTIGHTDDTDLITLADGIATVAGEISVTTLDIGGTNVTTTAAEINLIDGGTSRGTTAVADGDGLLVNDAGTMRMTNVTTLKTYFQTGISSAADDISAGDAAVNLTTSSGNITIDAAANDSDIIFKGTDDSSDITMLTLDGSDAGSATFNHDIILGNDSFVRFGDAGEKITGDGTDLTINSSNDLHLTATTDINVPANVGLTFGDDAEKIEGDGTDLTITGNNIKLTATADVVLAANTGLVLDGSGNEKIESDGTDISISVGSNGDINIPANIGVTFGDDGEKIEGDGTDLTIASSAKINLTATSDIHIPNDVGIVFGGDSEKIEGDGTDLTISANNLTVDAAADITLDAAGNNLTFKSGGTSILDISNSSSDAVITASVQDKDIVFKGDDNGSAITALTLDMSEAGAATFNSTVTSGAGLVIADAGNIGSASDTDAIAIASNGVVTFSQAPVFPDGSIAVVDLDIDGATDIGADIVDADLFIVDDGAGGTNRKVAASRIKTYIGGGTSWQAVKTGDFTASAGQGVFVNTTSAAITITLPAGTIGDEVSIVDYAGTFDSNACTVAANGSEKIFGSTDDLTVSTERAAFTLVFTDSTQGWLFKND